MRSLICIVALAVPSAATAANSYIEFGQFEKVRQTWIAAGTLYACSKDGSLDWETRHAYLFLHFTLEQIVDDYFKIAYRVIATQSLPVGERVAVVDEHRKVEAEHLELGEAGADLAGKSVSCEDAGAFAAEIMKYQE